MHGERLQAQIGQLQGAIVGLIHAMFRGIEEELRNDGLAVGEHAVLSACLMNEPITVSDIQKHVPVDTGRISRIVSRLEDSGYVRKTRLQDDRRIVMVEVTDHGRNVASQLTENIESFYIRIMSPIARDELTYLIAFIEKMVANAERE